MERYPIPSILVNILPWFLLISRIDWSLAMALGRILFRLSWTAAELEGYPRGLLTHSAGSHHDRPRRGATRHLDVYKVRHE
jgi:hypothetical protein